MRAKGLLCAVAATLLLAPIGCRNNEVAEEKDEKAEKIPLKSICVSFEQEGVKVVKRGEDRPAPGPALEVLMDKFESGASNVFLVYGEDVGAAASATIKVLTAARPADIVARAENGRKSKSVWLVAYLGIDGSDPPPGPSSPPRSAAPSSASVWRRSSVRARPQTDISTSCSCHSVS